MSQFGLVGCQECHRTIVDDRFMDNRPVSCDECKERLRLMMQDLFPGELFQAFIRRAENPSRKKSACDK